MLQITLYSTCQGTLISQYLKKYFINDNFNVIKNYQLVLYKKDDEIANFRNILQNTNIFIFQEMPKKWGEYSTDLSVENNILSFIPINCITIKIPYVYADWYWGIGKALLRDETSDFNKIDNETETKFKYCNKDVILNLKKKYNLDEILRMYDDNKLDFNYEERMKIGLDLLKSKEQTCDVKISDFIIKNYRTEWLFFTPNHPSHIIIKEMTKQILEILKIDYSNFDDLTYGCKYEFRDDWTFSKYDNYFHKFEFQPNYGDAAIKNMITNVYYSE